MALETIIKKFTLKIFFPTFLMYLSCQPTPKEECCSCLVNNKCVAISEDECYQKFFDYEHYEIPPDFEAEPSCVKKNNCYLPCAMAGAYFKFK